jgi:hypothetical protein
VVFNVSESSVRSSLFPLPRDVTAAATERVPAVSLEDAIQRAGGAITLLKLDVEGAEADILERSERATLQAIERVVVEYHDDLVPDALARSRTALEGAGFTCTVRRESADQGLLYAVRGPNR